MTRNYVISRAVVTFLFVLGAMCLLATNESTNIAEEVTSDNKEIEEFESRSKYIRSVITQIVKAAKQGDVTVARSYLMTDRFQKEYGGRFVQSSQTSLGRAQARMFFLEVAVNSLPHIGADEVIGLLVEYFYGNVKVNSLILDNKTMESLTKQLIAGTHVNPEQRSLTGQIEVLEVVRSTKQEKATTTAYIIYWGKPDAFIWFFEFSQYELDGRKVWLPTKWSRGGYI